MPIDIHCTQCGMKRRVNDRLAGRKVRCPECDAAIEIPAAAAVAEAIPVDEDAWTKGGDLTPPSSVDDDVDAVAAEPVVAAQPVAAQAVTAQPVAAAVATQAAVPQAVESTGVDAADEDDDDVLVRSKKPEEEMDMTPMVDVTFLLLIFFMVTAAFSLQKSIGMPKQTTDKPAASQTEEEEIEMIDLHIEPNGNYTVLSEDSERQTPSKQTLIGYLRDANPAEENKLNVKVHENAKLKFLVDAMDAGTIAMYSPILVTEVDGFD